MKKKKTNNLKVDSTCKTNIFSVITGMLSGFINGVFGGGGGMIVVPMLVYLLKREQKTAHATAILIILPLSIISGIFYAVFGNFDYHAGIPTGIGVLIGGLLGALLLSKLKSKWISVAFSVVMLAAGMKMLLW